MDKDIIIEQCYAMLEECAAEGTSSVFFCRLTNGLWQLLEEYDPKKYHERFTAGVSKIKR